MSLNFRRLMRASHADAVEALSLDGVPLRWTRLDDGVMGGRSKTMLRPHGRSGLRKGRTALAFAGTINTRGGGFASARARAAQASAASKPQPLLPADARSLRVRLRGDGHQYKLLLSGGGGGPFSASPSWQHDMPTRAGVAEEKLLPLEAFRPSFGGSPMRRPEQHALRPGEVSEVGLMLSLKDSAGEPNPAFGVGEFGFELIVSSIEVVRG